MTRPAHGARRRCTCASGDACGGTHTQPCKQFARRASVPPRCAKCGGGTRAETKHLGNGDTKARGLAYTSKRVQALLDGTLSVEDLDDEELARGYPRAEDGTFRGRPSVVPTAVHQRVQRELFRRAGEQLKTNLIAASQTMSDIATNKELDPAVRMKAAQWLIERLMGKTPEVTTTMDEKRYEKLLSDIDRGAIPVDEEGDGREA